MIVTVRVFYMEHEESPRDLNSLIDYVRRAWSARTEDRSGMRAVGASLDPPFIKEQTLAALIQVGYVLHNLGLHCEELLSTSGAAHPFHSSKIRRGDISTAFWGSSCPVASAAGFIGRFSTSHGRRFRSVWQTISRLSYWTNWSQPTSEP